MTYVKYKESDDMVHASRANDYIKANPSVSRTELSRVMGMSRERLDRLARIGLIVRYPRPMSHGDAARVGRRKGNPWGSRFYLRGTPTGGVKSCG